MATTRRRVPVTPSMRAALAAVALSMAFFVFELAWDDPTPVAEAPREAPGAAATPTAAEPPDEPAATFSLKPSEDYAEMVERPLFVRGRKPPPEDGKPGGQTAGEDAAATQISLSGILLTGKHRVALLRLDNDPKVMHVSEGQEAGGWLIETIRPDRVLMRRGETSTELVLDFRRKPEGAGAGRPGRSGGEPATPGSQSEEPAVGDEDTGE